jgi:hypothetical protein
MNCNGNSFHDPDASGKYNGLYNSAPKYPADNRAIEKPQSTFVVRMTRWLLLIIFIMVVCWIVAGCRSGGLFGFMDIGGNPKPKNPCPGDGATTTYQTLAAMAWIFIPLGIAGLMASHWVPFLKHIAGSVLLGGIVAAITPWALDAIGVQLKWGAWGAAALGVVFLAYWLTLKGVRMYHERKTA